MSDFDEAAIDVVCVGLHDLLDLADPGEVVEVGQLLPALLVARLVEIA